MIDFLKDLSGRNFDLTNYNNVDIGIGKYGYCADFGVAATNKGLARAGNVMSALKTPNYYFSLLLKLNAEITTGSQRIFEYQSNLIGTGQCFYLDYQWNAGTPRLVFTTELTTTNAVATKNITLGTSQWYSIVCVKSGTTKNQIFLNGVLVAEHTGVGTDKSASSGTHLFTLGNTKTLSGGIKAKIDEFISSENTITPEQIRRYYAWQRGLTMMQ